MHFDSLDAVRQLISPTLSIDDPIKAGGQGKVFRGTFEGRLAAIKLFAPDQEERVRREVTVLKQIDCPHVVQVLHSEEIRLGHTDVQVVAYEFLAGGDLGDDLTPEKPAFGERTIALVGYQVGIAIETVWGQPRRIVHRDIKPANIMRRAPEIFVLVDWGFARHLDRSDITAVGQCPGTNGFRSPEQASGWRNLSIRSDVFSLGITLHCLAAKRHPLDGQHRGEGPARTESRRPDLPQALCRLIDQMMQTQQMLRPLAISQAFAAYL